MAASGAVRPQPGWTASECTRGGGAGGFDDGQSPLPVPRTRSSGHAPPHTPVPPQAYVPARSALVVSPHLPWSPPATHTDCSLHSGEESTRFKHGSQRPASRRPPPQARGEKEAGRFAETTAFELPLLNDKDSGRAQRSAASWPGTPDPGRTGARHNLGTPGQEALTLFRVVGGGDSSSGLTNTGQRQGLEPAGPGSTPVSPGLRGLLGRWRHSGSP